MGDPPRGVAMNSTVEGVKPATIVQLGETSVEQLEGELKKVREAHAQLLAEYHKVWYESCFTWPYTHFLGVGMMKCPNDLWMYQAIMTRLLPKTIIETGTYLGGSALWFAYLMDMLRIEGGRIYTIDFEAYDLEPRVRHPRITYLHGNSVDPDLVAGLRGEIADGPLLVCLDSDHSAKHVREELELYAPLCKVGDWLVVEDTNIGWSDGKDHKVTFNGDLGKCQCGMQFMLFENARDIKTVKCPHDKNDLGARGGLIDYMEQHPNEWRQDMLSERYLLTMNPGGWLERVGECTHG
jgi:cephalosporin hydroxylase